LVAHQAFDIKRGNLLSELRSIRKAQGSATKSAQAIDAAIEEISKLRPDEIASKAPKITERVLPWLDAQQRAEISRRMAEIAASAGTAATGASMGRLGIPGAGLLAGLVNPSLLGPAALGAVAANPTAQRLTGVALDRAARALMARPGFAGMTIEQARQYIQQQGQ
jgi:hypothetical protein